MSAEFSSKVVRILDVVKPEKYAAYWRTLAKRYTPEQRKFLNDLLLEIPDKYFVRHLMNGKDGKIVKGAFVACGLDNKTPLAKIEDGVTTEPTMILLGHPHLLAGHYKMGIIRDGIHRVGTSDKTVITGDAFLHNVNPHESFITPENIIIGTDVEPLKFSGYSANGCYIQVPDFPVNEMATLRLIPKGARFYESSRNISYGYNIQTLNISDVPPPLQGHVKNLRTSIRQSWRDESAIAFQPPPKEGFSGHEGYNPNAPSRFEDINPSMVLRDGQQYGHGKENPYLPSPPSAPPHSAGRPQGQPQDSFQGEGKGRK